MMSGAVMEARSRRLGLQHRNSVGRAVFLSKGQACHDVLPNEDLPDQKCRWLGCRRCWSRQDSAHGHSQTQRLLFWTVFAVALGASEAHHLLYALAQNLKTYFLSHVCVADITRTSAMLSRHTWTIVQRNVAICELLQVFDDILL